MIIDEDSLEYKTHNTGWAETYQYDTLLKGVQERGLNLVKGNSHSIINFFENYTEEFYRFDSRSFLPNLYLYWIRHQAGYYHERNRVESYWNRRISVAGGGVPTKRPYERFDMYNGNKEDDEYIINLLLDLTEHLEKDSVWSKLPVPVKMYYCSLFVVCTFDIDRYYHPRHNNWINSSVCFESYEGCKLHERLSVQIIPIDCITLEPMLKTFYRNTGFSAEPLQYANSPLKDMYSTEEVYNKLYVPLFSEIYEYLEENNSLRGLQFDIKSTIENKVFDERSYREEMAKIETDVLNSRFAAERPIKDTENEKQVKGRRKQNKVRNEEVYSRHLILFWVVVVVGCLVYPFVGR